MVDFKNIKLLYINFENVLTDGSYGVSRHREVFYNLYLMDFVAMSRAIEDGIFIAISGHSDMQVVTDEINSRLPVPYRKRIITMSSALYNNCHDRSMDTIVNQKTYLFDDDFDIEGWSQVAYLGAWEEDLDSIEQAGWSGCPSDALPIIKENVHFVTERSGGAGAVHEFITDLLDRRSTINV